MTSTFLKKLRMAVGGLVALAFTGVANAGVLEIQFSGLNLVYDGSNIYDAGGIAGGSGNPSESDPLITMSFIFDGSLLGTLTSDIYADVLIQNVANIPVGGGTVTASQSDTFGFDLLTSNAGWGLALNLDADVQINYNGSAITVQGSGSTSSIFSQNLPFDLFIYDVPVLFSFTLTSVQNLTDNGTYLTGFTGGGTGVVSSNFAQIPEPSILLLMGSGLLVLGFASARRRA